MLQFSFRHLKFILIISQELQSEANALKPQQEEVLNLSNTVLMFLRECSASSASILKEKLDGLNDSYKR